MAASSSSSGDAQLAATTSSSSSRLRSLLLLLNLALDLAAPPRSLLLLLDLDLDLDLVLVLVLVVGFSALAPSPAQRAAEPACVSPWREWPAPNEGDGRLPSMPVSAPPRTPPAPRRALGGGCSMSISRFLIATLCVHANGSPSLISDT